MIGGFVYRGSVPDLYGQYVFGDALGPNADPRGRLFYMDPAGGPVSEFRYAADSLAGDLVYGFGEAFNYPQLHRQKQWLEVH